VEREAARKALSNATREDILRMTLILEEMEEILKGQKGDNEVFYRADIEFHRALVSASHDNMLIKIFSFITAPVFRVATPLSELMPTHLDHRQILEAIKHADEKTLESHINRHLGNYDKTRGE
jgi:DNA-binding FadR family transcriptional regulator